MSSLFRSTLVAISLLLTTGARAQETIPWAASLEQAQRAATEQRKLLLLHFYNDHCPPCERLEQTVFNQPHVAQAISRNYIPVKVHAGLQARVAEHYRVNRWPTDIVCTAAGQEIHRTTSPRTASEYVTFCDSQAMQAGVGATRQWATSMQAAGQQLAAQPAGQAYGAFDQAAASGQGYLTQANTAVQNYAQQTDQQITTAAQHWNQSAELAQGPASNWSRQVADSSRQLAAAGEQIGATAAGTAADLRTRWDPTNLRAPAPLGAGGAAVTQPAAASPTSIYQSPAPQQVAAQQIVAQPLPQQSALPTSNPWIGQQTAPPAPVQQTSPSVATIAPQPATTQPAWQPSGGSATSTPVSPYSAHLQPQQPQSSPPAAQPHLIPASEAPPIALEGYCVVTLLEQRKWRRADVKYGAIHEGRTYLFVSAAEQTRFLTDPNRYSPAFSGFDPVALANKGQRVDGKRSYGTTYQKQLFLFADEASRNAFEAAPLNFIGAAYQAMRQAEAGTKYR